MRKKVIPEQFNPVFRSYGMDVYSKEYIDYLREENLEADGPIYNLIPQKGFQEKIMEQSADILIIGGKRGGGKSYGMLLMPLRYCDNPLFSAYGFRKEEDDIRRGIWATSKTVYGNLAVPTTGDLLWKFPSGAFIKFEHLQNENEVDRRFRGVEMIMEFVDEVTQISQHTFFTLLASNRNSLGFKNQLIASCNPVGPKHWVHKLLSWYIDPDTKTIIPERDGLTRYFFKYGKTVEEMCWGATKQEVYDKARYYIDEIWDERLELQGRNKLDMINSLCFIEGHYAENAIFQRKDPSYLGNLAQQGGEQSRKDINGIWTDDYNNESIFSQMYLEDLFENPPQYTDDDELCMVIDVAFTRDGFVIGIFKGNHLIAMKRFEKIGSITAVTCVQSLAEEYDVPIRNIVFDCDGVGNYLREPLHEGSGGAMAFNGNSSSSNRSVWYNLKSECAELLALKLKNCGLSIDKKLLDTAMGTKTLRERLIEQAPAFRLKENANKFQLITKAEMKRIIGCSPDEFDVLIMHEKFVKRKHHNTFQGLQLLNRL